jgi:hypothetical protein
MGPEVFFIQESVLISVTHQRLKNIETLQFQDIF